MRMTYAAAGYYGDGVGELSGSSADHLLVGYANESDLPERVGYDVFVSANASELELAPPPVDEPAGAGMLASGALLLLGSLGRRRRQADGHAAPAA